MPTNLEILYANVVLNDLAMEFRDLGLRYAQSCGIYKVEGDTKMSDIYADVSDAYYTAERKTREKMKYVD